MNRIVAACALALALAIPCSTFATESYVAWWRHSANSEACISGAQSAMAVAGMTDVHRLQDLPFVSGRAGEYVAVASCIDQVATLTVSGPTEPVAQSLLERIRASWR